MRSQTRSDNRPPDPSDDWVDGSWTVDCVCGVNFDDGEEMVNCDECGVWVHTRCSRYVKSEKLFACDKCKTNKNKRRNDLIEEEETEVAQLLVEMPTKTLRSSMGNTNPNPNPRHGFRRRLWTEIPMEERVHVQGIPGGDPVLFGGLSSVFGPQLWKCTGYVPKKFNFQYKEFSCWDEDNETPANNGAQDVAQFSLSKEKVGLFTDSLSLRKVVLPTVSASLGGGINIPVGITDATNKKGEGEDLDVRSIPQNGVKRKDRSSFHSTMSHSGKRKKEDTQTSKDQSGRKKARVVNMEGENSKKRYAHASRTVSTLSGDAKQLEFYEGRVLKVDKNFTQKGNNEKSKGSVPADTSSEGLCMVGHEVDDSKNNIVFMGHSPETLSCVETTNRFPFKARPKDKNGGATTRLQISTKVSDGTLSSVNHDDSGSFLAKEKVVGDALANVNDKGGRSITSEGSDLHKPEPPVEDVEPTVQVKESQINQGSSGDVSVSSSHKNKTQVDILNSIGVSDVQSSPPCDVKLDNLEPPAQHPADVLSKNVIMKDAAVGSSQSIDQKVEDVDKNTVIVRESSSECKYVRRTDESSKSGGTDLSPSEPPGQHKMVVPSGKSSSTKLTTLTFKSSASDSRKMSDAQNHNSSTKDKGMPEHKVSSKKDNSSAGVVKDSDWHEKAKKIAKELPKSSACSVKTSQHSSKSTSSVSTRNLSESKESVGLSSAKPSLVQRIANIPSSGESPGSLDVENKSTASGLQQRSQKVNHLNSQPSAKVNHAPQMHPPAPSNSHATLSDEELALLLHQELNSSPRVPRVPRMRHAGSLPQLASPTGTSTLMKRTSSCSAGKDHGLVFKRKSKDLAKEKSHSSHELQDESKTVNRSPFLPNQRRNDSARTADSVTEGEGDNGLAEAVQSVNKSIPRAVSTEANGRNMSSTRNSPQNASEVDTDVAVRPTHRTLPGLLSEIMSKGERMTYEQLCNDVLPHWPHLRKHNGERYAYASHSQAVLDCLRNRSEWARLVDRGPKTNAGKKRCRADAEAPHFESHQDQFPKGRRKARKRRRRLALHGRSIKDVTVRRGTRHKDDDVSYDEDICSLSNSSSAEESMFSEDEGEDGTSPAAARCEASASSEE